MKKKITPLPPLAYLLSGVMNRFSEDEILHAPLADRFLNWARIGWVGQNDEGGGAGAKLGWLSSGEVLMQLIQTPSLKLNYVRENF